MAYHLGVDIGTTSAKAIAFSEEGEVLSRHAVIYAMHHTARDRSEQDPDDILRAVVQCINAVAQAMLPMKPDMVSFSAAMHSFVAVDKDVRPLTPLMIWADNRAAAIADALRMTAEGREFYMRTGVPVHAMSPFCKLLWLRRHEPAVFSAARWFLGIKEYVFLKLFGVCLVDSSLASATGLYNLHRLEWDEQILQYVSVDCSKLARVVPPRHFFAYDADQGDYPAPLMIPGGTPIIIGGSDGALANLATAALGSEVMAVTIGTSGAVRMIHHAPEVDTAMRTFCYHVDEDLYVKGGATNNGAIVLQWLKEDVLDAPESYEELMMRAAMAPPGSDGLLCIPYILGERAPVWDSGAKGLFFGLDIRHRKAHVVRAAMEGVVYGLYHIGQIVSAGRAIKEVHATGGFSRSKLWLQMLADMFCVKVRTFGEDEGSAMGAVVLGVQALGLTGWLGGRGLAVYEPDKTTHRVYCEMAAKFQRLYEKIKEEF